jgi:DNA end-binding protein Ku
MGTDYPTPARGNKLTISFGLVNVGVKYAPLVQEQRTKGHYVDPETLGPVKQQYVRESDGAVVQPALAYDHSKGLVVLQDRDALKSAKDGRLELRAFMNPDLIDPLYLEKAYLVWPDKGQTQGYDLLCDVLQQTGNVLVGTAVLTKATRVVMLRYGQGCLLAHVCAYDANVSWSDHKLVAQGRAERPVSDERMVQTALELLGGLSQEFDMSSVSDEYDERLRAAIGAQAAGVELPAEVLVEQPQAEDLMAALKASVAAAKEPKKEPAKKRTKAAAKKKGA